MIQLIFLTIKIRIWYILIKIHAEIKNKSQMSRKELIRFLFNLNINMYLIIGILILFDF